MIANCLIIAIAFRSTHEGSKLQATIREKGPRGVFPHFYIVLDNGTRIDYRSLKKPLGPTNQLLFKGKLVIKRGAQYGNCNTNIHRN